MKPNNTNSVYVYRSPFGDFVIKYVSVSEKWLLSVNDTGYSFFQSPEKAAESVAHRKSGYYKWDELTVVPDEAPGNITAWEVYQR